MPTTLLLAATTVGVLWYWNVAAASSSQSNEREDKDTKETEEKKTSNGTLSERESIETSLAPIAEIDTNGGSSSSKQQQMLLEETLDDSKFGRVLAPGTITIAHGSVTGTCEKLAKELMETLKKTLPDDKSRTIQMGKLEDWDWWDELVNDETTASNSDSSSLDPVLLVVLPTHHAGSWAPPSVCFKEALQELKNDWRIAKHPLKKSKLTFSVMGMGCSDYDDGTMGKPAKEAFYMLKQLGASSLGKRVRVGDDATGSQDRVLQAWIHHDILPKLIVSDDDDEEEDYMKEKEPEVIDVEDMGKSMEQQSNSADDEDEDGDPEVTSKGPREMVTKSQAVALKKEGYKLIGTHSAVKLCRWTKHQLRGRGGCYKHTFYGITSYQCMEATPSLACANKCVFCWRHHKNPVAKEWKWKTDDPHFIVEQAVQKHVQMIKETKGIPGVNMERWEEAHTVRHCALSLVGEPIMYPRINELLGDLHNRDISSFLVTNGQHPTAIGSLRPVTQLYVSVDAPTPESLVEIDRPLFSDAWDRLKESLVSLKDKGQRTVARLTVVKGWNSDEVEGYAKLIALGKVSLVEVKGVTFCGKSDASNLNIGNSPWHHEVVEMVKKIKMELDKLREAGGPDAPPEYDLACEHRHSVSVLLARVDQFTDIGPDGQRRWRTWINYPKFHELAAKHAEDPTFTFGVEDYTEETPAWALFGSEEEGFDPTDQRHRRKAKTPKYTKFDSRGVPTHDHKGEILSSEERTLLNELMDQKLKEVGAGTTVTQLKSGEKLIDDASLMFRGLTIETQ